MALIEAIGGGKGSDVYSTTETKTNKVWIDGKPIYRTVFTGLNFGDALNAWTSLGVSISNLGTLVYSTALRTRASGTTLTDTHPEISIGANSSGNLLYYTFENSAGCNMLIVEYTKTTN